MKIAVLGCGYWGKNLVRNFHELGVLAAVVDPLEKSCQLAQTIAPNIKTYSDPIAVLNDPTIDGVVIATPAEFHARDCLQVLNHGKHVFCEKPLALDYQDAKQVVLRAKELSKVLMVGHILEYHPAIRKLKAIIDQGEMGKIQYIYSSRLNLGKIRREENILWSFAPHDVAVILRLVGQMPFQVVACGGSYIQPNVADVTITHMLFDNGVVSHIFVSWLNPFKEQRLVVVGSKKMATFDDVQKKLIVYDQRVDIKAGDPVPVKGEGLSIEYDSDEPLKLECKAFLEAIRSGKNPLTDGISALKVLRILNAAERSLITQGQPVALPVEEW